MPDRSSSSMRFQSTLPVWGATLGQRRAAARCGISIHAPRVGSDTSRLVSSTFLRIFQSTLPVWGATLSGTAAACQRGFQSTLPVWGATGPSPRSSTTHLNFNPRSPCGERPCSCPGPACCRCENFNPRSPCGERLRLGGAHGQARRISIHAPRVGSDSVTWHHRPRFSDFNPRSPCGERRWTSRPPWTPGNFNPRSPCGERRSELASNDANV